MVRLSVFAAALLTFCSLVTEAAPVALEEEEEEPVVEAKCGQWVLNATPLFSARAKDENHCYSKCTEFSSYSAMTCDVSLFDASIGAGKDNCVFLDSSKPQSPEYELKFFKAGQTLCTSIESKVKVTPAPKGGCSQFAVTGTVLPQSETVSKSPSDCMDQCKNNQECTHALYRTVVGKPKVKGMCRLFKADSKNGTLLEYHPMESICTKYKCGRWETQGLQLNEIHALDHEECARKCVTGECDQFIFSPSIDPENNVCFRIVSLKPTDTTANFAIGEEICTFNMSFVGPVPPKPKGACKQIQISGNHIPNTREPGTTVRKCTERCNAHQNCTHALFNPYANGTTICTLFQENRLAEGYRYMVSESICRRTKGKSTPLPLPVTDGRPRCGQWEFNRLEIQTVPALNKYDCQSECDKVKNCDAYFFDGRPNAPMETGNCALYDSRKNSDYIVTYHFGTELCSTKFQGVEMPFPRGGCPITKPMFGYVLEDKLTYQTTAENCLDACNKEPDCTHANYYSNMQCYLFAEGGTEEFELSSGDSLCPRTLPTDRDYYKGE